MYYRFLRQNRLLDSFWTLWPKSLNPHWLKVCSVHSQTYLVPEEFS